MKENGNTKKIGSKINDRTVKLKKKPTDALLLTANARLQMRPLDQFELKHSMVNMFYKLSSSLMRFEITLNCD